MSRWPESDTSRIPYWVYRDQTVYQQELEKIFYGDHWIYVGLECEIPNTGDFKTSWVGEREVIVARHNNSIQVFENRCAHRGVRFCQKKHGNATSLVCPYHQWRYNLSGDLIGVPFERGVAKGDRKFEGMPADFDKKQNGTVKLNVACLHGVIFASFSHTVEPVEQYLGPTILPWFERTFKNRKLKILGYNRHKIPGNWKLMMENIKDPYHAGLLHTWFVTFGLFRADQSSSRIVIDSTGRHAVMLNRRNQATNNEVTQGIDSYKHQMTLHDPRMLDIVEESWWSVPDPDNPGTVIDPTTCMQTLFPSVVIHQQINSLSTRQIVPRGNDCFEFNWTHFGFEDDSEEMTLRRLRQANLYGPAGFVSGEDSEVLELCQQGFDQWQDQGQQLVQVGGKDTGETTDHPVTETLLRGMYRYWKKVMGYEQK